MERDIMKQLVEWKDSVDRKPLLLTGNVEKHMYVSNLESDILKIQHIFILKETRDCLLYLITTSMLIEL